MDTAVADKKSKRDFGASLGGTAESREYQTGEIRWFDPQRRFGFVIPDNGDEDVFLYWRELSRAGIRESECRDGRRVKFTTKRPDNPGRCSRQVDAIVFMTA